MARLLWDAGRGIRRYDRSSSMSTTRRCRYFVYCFHISLHKTMRPISILAAAGTAGLAVAIPAGGCTKTVTVTVTGGTPLPSSAPAYTAPTSVASSAAPSATNAGASTGTGTTAGTSNGRKLQFWGMNESGAEFGTAIPGVYGKDYTWYNLSTYDVRLLQTYIKMKLTYFRSSSTRATTTSASTS